MNDTNILSTDSITITHLYHEENKSDLIHEIWTGLSAQQKYIASKFFYNDEGSALFEDITALPEYYPARTEKKILRQIAHKVVGTPEHLDIIELGSGDHSKISILLDAIPAHNLEKVRYIPVDVSKSAVMKSATYLSEKYERMHIHGLVADFVKHLGRLPQERQQKLICFFGGTFGNLTPYQAQVFLNDLKACLQPGDRFLLGIDRVKDIHILENAYNDQQGVTAAFNKNILHTVNAIAGTNFNPRLFEHMAHYNTGKHRIEMHLKAIENMVVTSTLLPEPIHVQDGETIHTENSHKFSYEHIVALGNSSGLELKHIFSDENTYFSVIEFENPQ